MLQPPKENSTLQSSTSHTPLNPSLLKPAHPVVFAFGNVFDLTTEITAL